MPWKERTKAMIRGEFVRRVLEGRETKSALCREYGISRPTGDKWIKRYMQGEGLEDRSREPLRQANRIPQSMEEQIIQLRHQYPKCGSKKLKRMLEDRQVPDVPCAATVNNVLRRHELITAEASKAATPYKRFVMPNANDMWQSDYKGHFPLLNGDECHPLNIIDDHSRYCLCSEAMVNETFESFQPVLIRLFVAYGMPKYFLCDNGNPWGSGRRAGYSRNDVWLMQLGILPLHGRLHHPQTQGKDESFNRSMTRELLTGRSFKDLAEAQNEMNSYRTFYNEIRPHHALGLDVPAKHYSCSKRQYPGIIQPWEYPESYRCICVGRSGHFKYKGHEYYLGEAFRGEIIGMRPSSQPGFMTLEYRNFRISRIDLIEECLVKRNAYLLHNDPREPR